jgi:hypothetical protein
MFRKSALFFTLILVSISVFPGFSLPKKSKNMPTEWNGVNVEHVFFHPAIVTTSLAYKGNGGPSYIRDWFVTTSEMKAFIQQSYERGYVLVSLKDVFEEKNGKLTAKSFTLPAGKKPMILSIDDVNYYPTMQKRGVTKKLVVKNNKLISIVNTDQGEKEVEDAELMPFVDSFVKKHPDFSYRGAKGIIALTGYNGIFGYATHKLKNPEYKSELAQASSVVQYLKKQGWEFASHGYRHLREPKQSYEKLEHDMNLWRTEVEPIIGKTNVYIFPGGYPVKDDNPLFEIYRKNGFKYFFGTNFHIKWTIHPDNIYSDRIPIDGKYLMGRVSGSKSSQFCSIQSVVSPERVATEKYRAPMKPAPEQHASK